MLSQHVTTIGIRSRFHVVSCNCQELPPEFRGYPSSGIERKTDRTQNGKTRTLVDVNLEDPDVNIKSYHCQETVWKVRVI